jgi:hypothetical protein
VDPTVGGLISVRPSGSRGEFAGQSTSFQQLMVRTIAMDVSLFPLDIYLYPLSARCIQKPSSDG